MRGIFIVSIMMGLVLFFQNCSQKSSTAVPETGFKGDASVVQKQFDLSLASSLEITSPGASGILGKTTSNSFTEQSLEISFLVDLATGRIEEQNETTGSSEIKYCLTSDEMKEVRDILYSSAVCKATTSAAVNNSCIAIYRAPYAVVNFSSNNEGVSLGEQTSGCDYGTDLCGQQASMLKGFLVHVLQTLSTHACSQ